MSPVAQYVLQTLITLVAVAALGVGVLYAVRRTGMGRPMGPVALTGRLVLDARRAVYLVRVGETVFVIGASEAGLTKLGELPSATLGELPATPLAGGGPSFRQVLERLGGTTRGSGGAEGP